MKELKKIAVSAVITACSSELFGFDLGSQMLFEGKLQLMKIPSKQDFQSLSFRSRYSQQPFSVIGLLLCSFNQSD
jgi:hypothetical protein